MKRFFYERDFKRFVKKLQDAGIPHEWYYELFTDGFNSDDIGFDSWVVIYEE